MPTGKPAPRLMRSTSRYALDKSVADLDEVADLLARAALLAAGFHQHRRAPWRRRRAPTEHVPGPDGPGHT
jgi:hypothetical protein